MHGFHGILLVSFLGKCKPLMVVNTMHCMGICRAGRPQNPCAQTAGASWPPALDVARQSPMKPVFTNDAVVLGLLFAILAFVFVTSRHPAPAWQRFYRFCPPLLLCYFLPALCHEPLHLISSENSQLYFVASRYLLPASLILLCLSVDLKGVLRLGPKALIMFFTATLGVVAGGPIALLTMIHIFPNLVPIDPDETWKALSTVAGSWIGGGANQTAMKEIFQVGDGIFATMVVIDVLVANVWLGFLLYGASIHTRIDRWLGGDTSSIEALKARVESYRGEVLRMPDLQSLMLMLALAFGGVALSHAGADTIAPWMQSHAGVLEQWRLHALASDFFWMIVIATTVGVGLSFTKARRLEGIGASTWGSIFLYILVATIGMKMNIREIGNHLGLFAVGFLWITVHVILLLTVAKIIRAPFFFVAVGSQANIGGAASAPVVASAFSPALAPVGVLMAVLGYALGTYGAIICAYLMQAATA